MRVRIDEAGEYDLTCAVDFENLFAIGFYPGITQRVSGLTNRNDLARHAKNRSVFDNSKFAKLPATTRAGTGRVSCQGQELSDVHQKRRPELTSFSDDGQSRLD